MRAMLRRGVCVVVLALTAACSAAGASVRAGHEYSFLDLKAGQCSRGIPTARAVRKKLVLVLPCSNGTHTLETYAVLHGGWGHRNPPGHPLIDRIAYNRCLTSFRKRFAHP